MRKSSLEKHKVVDGSTLREDQITELGDNKMGKILAGIMRSSAILRVSNSDLE